MLKIHSIETLGAHDGPGIRTVFFLQGCPMRCIYCHNPDAIRLDGGEIKDAKQLCEMAKKYKSYYGTDGGVTLSGGEPLMQASGVIELLIALRAENIHTALDISGEVFCPEALDLADLVILDIKHTDADIYKKITGFPIDNMLKTLEYLIGTKKSFIVRQVILTGYTDNEAQVKKLAEMTRAAKRVELLPFHNMGAHKYEKLGIDYALKNLAPPSKETMLRLKKIISDARGEQMQNG